MRYFIGFLVTIGLIILLIFMLFHGGSKPKVQTTSKTLDSYANTSAEVSMTIDGPVNANSQHSQVRIIVGRNAVTYQQLQGYDDSVVNQQQFPNTQSAYTSFLLSLAHAGFTNYNDSSTLQDERGYCPTGDRYVFELNKDGESLERAWTTSCGSPKTYGGNTSLTSDLFRAQVPNYDTLVQNVEL